MDAVDTGKQISKEAIRAGAFVHGGGRGVGEDAGVSHRVRRH